MKYVKLISISFVFIFSISSIHAQPEVQEPAKPYIISSYKLGVSTNKTTNLLFPYSIKSVDRGSADILAQKALGTENVLQVKAANQNFEETNLSVITADGLLYSFLVDYIKNPIELNLSFQDGNIFSNKPLLSDHAVRFVDSAMTEKQLQIYTRETLSLKNHLHGVKDHSYQVVLKITGIYVKNEQMFFKLKLKNYSNIDYDIEQLRFFIRDQKKVKRTASQEIEIKPDYIQGAPSTIKGGSQNICVFVLPKFTIPDQKYFTLEMAEKNGGRFLHIIIHNKTLMKSVVL